MIQLNKTYSLPERLAEVIPIKIVSIGGAGLNALDRIVLDGLERADVVAINTDVHSLTSSVATRKVQLGRSVSRGLGGGGGGGRVWRGVTGGLAGVHWAEVCRVFWVRGATPMSAIKPPWSRPRKFARP